MRYLHRYHRLLLSSLVAVLTVLMSSTAVAAQIVNKAVPEALGSRPDEAAAGVTFVSYFVSLWRAIMVVGALIVFFYFIWGAIEWIVAGGDSGKLNKARDRMVQSVIGLIILVSSATIIGFIGRVFFGPEFDLLRLRIPDAASIGGGSGSGSGTPRIPGDFTLPPGGLPDSKIPD